MTTAHNHGDLGLKITRGRGGRGPRELKEVQALRKGKRAEEERKDTGWQRARGSDPPKINL